jgi:hypothetical protein
MSDFEVLDLIERLLKEKDLSLVDLYEVKDLAFCQRLRWLVKAKGDASGNCRYCSEKYDEGYNDGQQDGYVSGCEDTRRRLKQAVVDAIENR